MTISSHTWFKQNKNIVNKHYLTKRINAKFIIGIIKKLFQESKHPNQPWLTQESNKLLQEWIKPNDIVLEFGSGQSTIWFSNNTKNLTSVEHDRNWYKTTSKKIINSNHKVDLILGTNRKDYLKVLIKFPDNSIDICLVDGEWRRDCILGVFKKIKKGGMIILDNAETYLPVNWPSRSFQDTWVDRGKPEKNKAYKIMAELKKWRIISTSDVSQDTVFFIKK